MKQQRKWTDDEIETLKYAVESGCSVGRIAKMLRRTDRSVRAKAYKVGISFNEYKHKRSKEKFFDYQVRCPFFASFSQSEKRISCEGLDEGSLNCIKFNSEKLWVSKMNNHCCDEWSQCLVAKALEGKYE